MTDETPEKSDVAKREEDILAFWRSGSIFEKTEAKKSPRGEFVFYDGPPFANGLPHYGHLLAGTIKDAIPRYKTMRGFHVARRWGWDCHGLPVENLIEKELGLKGKGDIIDYGVERFNEAARVSIMKDADAWKRIVPRLGRFVNMEHDYKTMDTSYTESVWWAFKTLFDKGLVYEGFKAMQMCPRCGTTLSNFEVSQGYKDIVDFAVTVKFELVDTPKTYLLIWTTTPWTLPGNMAVAVHRDAVYVEVSLAGENLILAKDRLGILDGQGEVVREMRGADLVGKKYTPPFDYYRDVPLKGKENAWKIYHADYVTMDDGTGLVHLAPAFGEDDLEVAKAHAIPLVHHVGLDGAFTPEVKDFAGMLVKPKDDHQRTDIEIIKYLAHAGLLFKKEKITHSYPHCWRCDTPLLNYASSSWFVKVTSFRDKLVAENKKIRWVPADIREGRFGKWLEGARDWAISRSRFWGAPIPVWKDAKGKLFVLGSIEELKKHIKTSGNTYFVMRHGEAEHNVRGIASSDKNDGFSLTEKGKEQVKKTALSLRGKGITRIYTSPFTRSRETALLVAETLNLPLDSISADERLHEFDFGAFSGKPFAEYLAYEKEHMDTYDTPIRGGESYLDAKKRFGAFLYETESSLSETGVLIVSHGIALETLTAVVHGADMAESKRIIDELDPKQAEVRELSFVPLPHNKNYEIDLHRPYIDDVVVVDEKGESLSRVPDVFDCWFESGSMPYASNHYPFEKSVFNPKGGLFTKAKGYPADFIAEGLDQTRGWFYSLLVLGVGLFGTSPYRTVIVNGTVLAEDGQKMSKRLQNYPDPMTVVNQYGADAIRYYLLSSPVIRAEDFNFSEKGVGDVMRKNIGRLSNVLSFYKLYADGTEPAPMRAHVLDRWILSRLSELIRDTTQGFEAYELDRATRPTALFIDDLSTWYLRRSRDRFKTDERDATDARATLRFVLREFSKVLAPSMPFFAEYLFREVRTGSDEESVHLAEWPDVDVIDTDVLSAMETARSLSSLGLEARTRAGIKVRQPLSLMRVEDTSLQAKEDFLALVRDEVNVKTIAFGDVDGVALDTTLTAELQDEGIFRDVVRAVQDLRKQRGLSPSDMAVLHVQAEGDIEEFMRAHEKALKSAVLLEDIIFGETDGEKVISEKGIVTLDIKR